MEIYVNLKGTHANKLCANNNYVKSVNKQFDWNEGKDGKYIINGKY